MTNPVSSFLMNHVDYVFAIYVVLCGLFVWLHIRSDWESRGTRAWEIALLVLSFILMPLIYIAMFWGSLLMLGLFAPQISVLALLACLTILASLGRQPFFGTPTVYAVFALAFVFNAIGYLWTRTLLFSGGL